MENWMCLDDVIPKKENQLNFRQTDRKKSWIDYKAESTGRSKEILILDAIDLLMAQEASVDHPNRSVEILEFMACINSALRMYRSSVELCEHAENRIREEFSNQLDCKDKIISEYQTQIATLQASQEVMVALEREYKALQAEFMLLNDQANKERIESEKRLAEKDRLLTVLDEDMVKYKAQAEGYGDLLREREALSQQLRDKNAEMMEREKDHQLALERAEMAAQQAVLEAVSRTKDELLAVLNETKERLAATLTEVASLRSFKDDNEALRESVGEKKGYITILEERIVTLQEQNLQLENMLRQSEENKNP